MKTAMVELLEDDRDGKLPCMSDDKQIRALPDRRARPRGGRRDTDSAKPWYRRHGWWLAAASMMFVGWKRVRRIV
jgi:hypothetical protein